MIEKASGYKYYMLSPAEIDNREYDDTNLNYMELDEMAKIANGLNGEVVTVDSPSANTAKVEKYLAALVKDKKIVARNYADRDFVEVSAASIIAKANREKEVAAIKKEIGYDFGSGYPSDPRTTRFLKIIIDNGKIEEDVYKKNIRKSWRTINKLKEKKLSDF